MLYAIRKGSEMSTLGVHRNSSDEALATVAEMPALSGLRPERCPRQRSLQAHPRNSDFQSPECTATS